jgi:hypothetical protein
MTAADTKLDPRHCNERSQILDIDADAATDPVRPQLSGFDKAANCALVHTQAIGDFFDGQEGRDPGVLAFHFFMSVDYGGDARGRPPPLNGRHFRR